MSYTDTASTVRGAVPLNPPDPLADPPPPGRRLDGLLYQSFPGPDGTLRIEYLSARAEDVLELTEAELADRLTTRTLSVFGVDEAAFYAEIERSAVNHLPWRVEFGYTGPRTGRRRWLQAADFPRHAPDGTPYFSGVVIDITALKVAEEQSRRAYRTLAAHLHNTPLAVVEWDAGRRFVRWSGQAEKLFGWTALEVVGRQFDKFEFVHPDDRERVWEVVARLLDGRDERNVTANRNLHKDGRVLACEWHNSVVRDGGGRVVSVLSLVLDQTERQRFEVELALSEERLKTALEFSKLLVWDFDAVGGGTYYSQHFGEYFGVPELGPNPGTDWNLACTHPDDRERVRAAAAAAMAGDGPIRFEFRGAADTPDGQPRWFDVYGQAVRDADGRLVRAVGVTAEVTERKQAERLREALDREANEARRYESLGVLAGGIAHDFNNLLTVILGNAGVGRLGCEPGSDVDRCLTDIEAACQRAAHLCSQMTAYAGVGRLAAGPVDLAAVLRAAEPVLRTDAGRVPLEWQVQTDLPPVIGESFQLRQAVRNLIVNAAEAVGHSGGAVRLELGAAHIDPTDGDYQLPPPAAGRYVRVRVADTGPGMTADVAARAFDPFFSTKFAGRGLGLAAVRGIVKSHRGAVRLTTAPGGGTAVDLFLPAAEPAGETPAGLVALSTGSVAVSAPAERSGAPALGDVLVADDEPNIRELIASYLADDGWRVTTAGDGAEAVGEFEADPQRFALAVVDLTMPRMGGHDVVRRLRAVRPGLPA
ncbi:MAG: PAS domain S-box protein, partial [Gemmataceae bacterium]